MNMNIKKIVLYLLIATILLVSGCSSETDNLFNRLIAQGKIDQGTQKFSAAGVAQPTALQEDSSIASEDVAAILPRSYMVTLQFPGKGDLSNQLVNVTEPVAIPQDSNIYSAILQCLLEEPSISTANRLFGRSVKLNSAILSNGLLTIDLAINANSLREEDFFFGVMALTNTLTALDDVRYVYLLFNGVPIEPRGLITNPQMYLNGYGALLYAEHSQIIADQEPQADGLGIFYFNDIAGQYLLSEVHKTVGNVNMPLQEVISEWLKGPQDTALLSGVPSTISLDTVTEAIDGVVSIYLTYPQLKSLDNHSIYLMIGAIVETCTSHAKDVSGYKIYINGSEVTSIAGYLTVTNGIFQAELFRSAIGNIATFYLPDDSLSYLKTVNYAVPYPAYDSGKDLLLYLLGSSQWQINGVVSPFPEGVTNEDILSVTYDGDCINIDLSSNFQQLCISKKINERLLLYSIVNTMTKLSGVARVQFYINGQAVESLTGQLNISTPLIANPGIIYK